MKYLVLLSLALVSLKAASQEKYIEVTVSDTAWVTPNQFIYTIMGNTSPDDFYINGTGADNTPGAYEKRKAARLRQIKLAIDSFENIARHRGFTILPQNISNSFNTEDDTRPSSFQVLTASADSVEMLYTLVKNNKFVYGSLTTVKATDEDVYAKKLLQKLIIQGRDKAATMAATGKLSLGNIISVKETPHEEGGWSAYPPLSAFARSVTPGWHTTIYPDGNYNSLKRGINNKYQIENTLVIRFAVE